LQQDLGGKKTWREKTIEPDTGLGKSNIEAIFSQFIQKVYCDEEGERVVVEENWKHEAIEWTTEVYE
jgi:hypothetical protein